MHKIFGTKENANYTDREGAYLIPIKGNKVGVVHTPKGFSLLGGGIEKAESHMNCIKRECMEEAGYCVSVRKCARRKLIVFMKEKAFFTRYKLIMLGI